MGGERRKRNRQPMMSSAGDSTIIKYSALGASLITEGTLGGTAHTRYYIPGFNGTLANSAGPQITSYYSTGKFLPGTKIRWEPSVSFTTPGRVLVGFTDNPEVAYNIQLLIIAFLATPNSNTLSAYLNAIRGLGSVTSFPVWQETDVTFPTKLRRKRFDTNSTVTNLADQYDRSMQTVMFAGVEGGPSASTSLGGFWYHDVVEVEGVQPTIT